MVVHPLPVGLDGNWVYWSPNGPVASSVAIAVGKHEKKNEEEGRDGADTTCTGYLRLHALQLVVHPLPVGLDGNWAYWSPDGPVASSVAIAVGEHEKKNEEGRDGADNVHRLGMTISPRGCHLYTAPPVTYPHATSHILLGARSNDRKVEEYKAL